MQGGSFVSSTTMSSHNKNLNNYFQVTLVTHKAGNTYLIVGRMHKFLIHVLYFPSYVTPLASKIFIVMKNGEC